MQNLKTWCWVLSDSARKYDHLTAQEVDELKSSGRPMLTKVFPAEIPRTDDLDIQEGRCEGTHDSIPQFVCLFFFTSIDEIPSDILCPKFSHRFRACKIYDQVVCFTWCGYVCSQITFWNLNYQMPIPPIFIFLPRVAMDILPRIYAQFATEMIRHFHLLVPYS